jgi:hypothetical protein
VERGRVRTLLRFAAAVLESELPLLGQNTAGASNTTGVSEPLSLLLHLLLFTSHRRTPQFQRPSYFTTCPSIHMSSGIAQCKFTWGLGVAQHGATRPAANEALQFERFPLCMMQW